MSADALPRRSDPGTSLSSHLLADLGRSALRVLVAACMVIAGVTGAGATSAISTVVEHAPATSIDELPAALPASEATARRTVVRRRRVRRVVHAVVAGTGAVRLRSWFLPAQRHRVPPVWRGPPLLRV